MEENTQTTAIAEANESAKERADKAIKNNQEFQAPTTEQIEGRTTPVETPTGEQNIPDLPVYSFFQPSQSEQKRAQTVQQGKEVVSEDLDDVYSQLEKIGTQGERTAEAEQEAGIPELNTQLVEVENELQAKSLQFRRERERLQTEAGLTTTQRNARLAEVSRKQNMELADLEIIRSARSNTLTNAQNLVNRKLELQFADEQTRLQGLQFIYEQNKDILTSEQDKLFQQRLNRENKQYQVEYDNQKRFEEEKMKYVQNAAQAGADNNTLKTIQSAQSLDELYDTDGIQQFALSSAEKLDIAIKRRNFNVLGIELQNAQEAQEAARNAREQGLLTEAQYEQANKLRDEWNGKEEVKSAKSLESDTASLLASLQQETGVGDIAAINSFQRLVVDPGVAVREGDVALLQSAQSWTDEATLKAKGLIKDDKLTPTARKQMEQVVKDVYSLRVNMVEENTEQIRTIADKRGIDFNKYVGKEFLDFETIQRRVKGQTDVQWGIETGAGYADSVIDSMSLSGTNPLGVSLE